MAKERRVKGRSESSLTLLEETEEEEEGASSQEEEEEEEEPKRNSPIIPEIPKRPGTSRSLTICVASHF